MAHRIKLARKEAGISQQQLASLAGLTQQMISKLESGRSQSTSGIIGIAQALNVSPEWLWIGAKNSLRQPLTNCAFCLDDALLRAWKTLSQQQRRQFKKWIIAAAT